jgi:energy-coupling factor transporter ATP-binding protein EcfA2
VSGFDVDAVAASVAADLETGIVVIDGPSGAGKSTFADALMRALAARRTPAALVRTDEFATWDDPAGWWPELEREVLRAFARGHDFRHRPRVWSGDTAEPGPRVWRRWEPLLVIEGVTSARRRVADRVAMSLWIDGEDRDARLERAVARDGESARPHLRRWQDFETGWFAVDRTRERCRVLHV